MDFKIDKRKINIIDEDNKKFFDSYCRKDGYTYMPTIIPAVERIIAIGDIHGDYELCIKLLKIGKVINDNLEWIGGSTVVVQVGDQVDRCRPFNNMTCNMKETTLEDENSDIKILKLFTKLDSEAQKNVPPGKVISLLGNHELLNVQGYMNYVSYEGLNKFTLEDSDSSEKQVIKSRQEYFKPGNKIAKFLACSRLGSIIIGSNLFVHAGLVDHFVRQLRDKKNNKTEVSINNLAEINLKIQEWLMDLREKGYVDDIISGGKYSMFWNRILGNLPEGVNMKNKKCSENISEVLKVFQINQMIIGHTPQSFIHNKQINATCSNKIWRIDNGSSKAFNVFDHQYMKTGIVTESRKPQVLEILHDSIFNILKE